MNRKERSSIAFRMISENSPKYVWNYTVKPIKLQSLLLDFGPRYESATCWRQNRKNVDKQRYLMWKVIELKKQW